MTIKQIIRLLWRYKFWIVLVPVFTAVGIFFLTKNLPRQYESKTVIFTNPSSNRGANDGGVVRMDFYTSNNLFDNLTLIVKSRETIETVSLKLLAQHLSIDGPEERVISSEAYQELKTHIRSDLWQKLAVNRNEAQTLANLKNHYENEPDSPVEYLLREHENYAIHKINQRLFVGRKASSDMMEISYRISDPGICFQTLKLVAESFMERYSNMKELENTNSINYFQNQLAIAQGKLKEAEDNLKAFMTGNRILNYYEQGKYLDIAQLEHDQDEERSKRSLSGTIANLKEIESMFDNFDRRQVIIQKISTLQDEIIRKNLQLQGLELQVNQTALSKKLEGEILSLKEEIQSESEILFKNSNSLRGVERETILEEWLRLKIVFEEQKQALSVMQDRKKYLFEKIGDFAPLGAELKKLEREVAVNESQYLSILNGLNMAFLQKYDLEMSSSQKLIDEPYFPKIPLPSKRLFMVAGSLVGSGFMVLSLVLVSFFLDRTIKSKENAEKLTRLKVVGGWINEKIMNKNVVKKSLENRQLIQFYNNINKYLPIDGKKIILFYSLKPGEGKTFLIKKFIRELQDQNRSVEYWGLKNENEDLPFEPLKYEIGNHFFDRNDNYWNERLALSKKEIILWELPNIEDTPLNYHLINKANLLIMVLDSSRKWQSADHEYQTSLTEMIKIPHLIWLNKMEGDELEDLNGEIPRKRSFLRTKIKNMIS